MTPKPEYQKFADDQVRARAHEEGIGRLRLALFVAALGPAALLISKVVKFSLERYMLFIYATAPLGILLLIINYIRLPGPTKGSKLAWTIVVMTLAAAAATGILPRILFPAASAPVS